MRRSLLAFLMLAFSGLASAADPMLGSWKLNLAKSTFNPGPAPKSVNVTYTKEGDWIVSKADVIDENGKPLTRNNRFKTDGGGYPFASPYGKGTISVKVTDDHHSVATLKLAADKVLTQNTEISADGKTRTIRTTGTGDKGQAVNNVIVYDRL